MGIHVDGKRGTTMNAKLTEKCFKGMGGAYAALFTPNVRPKGK